MKNITLLFSLSILCFQGFSQKNSLEQIEVRYISQSKIEDQKNGYVLANYDSGQLLVDKEKNSYFIISSVEESINYVHRKPSDDDLLNNVQKNVYYIIVKDKKPIDGQKNGHYIVKRFSIDIDTKTIIAK
jgi:CRISPR/Cas system CMR subunit Cmr4 (Cas7 group RAMP superfamily)